MTPRRARPRSILLAVVAAVLAAGALSACGSKQDTVGAKPPTQRLTLVLDYLPNADHAGIYAAQAAGAFARAGLDVRIVTPSDPSAPLKLLQAGRADLAISYEPELLLARAKGAKLVSVGALANRPLTSVMALGSAKIRTVADLKGKTVGTAGIPYQAAYLKTILTKAGVEPSSVKQIDVGFNLVPAMLSKKVDATLGAFWNYEGIQLQRQKKAPTIIRMETAGVPTYDELVLVGAEQGLRDHGELVRRFMQALQVGTRAVAKDPAAGVDPLVTANPDLDRGLQTAAVKATLPAFLPEKASQPFGYQDEAQWRAYGKWMLANGLVSRLSDPGAAFTNEFLPGEGPKPDDSGTSAGGSGF
jgi:putative hydroxymethylpyrimidine transport system substrate-binding protein